MDLVSSPVQLREFDIRKVRIYFQTVLTRVIPLIKDRIHLIYWSDYISIYTVRARRVLMPNKADPGSIS